MIFLPSALNRVAIDGPADPLTPSPEAVPEALTAENMTGKGRFTQSKNNERAPDYSWVGRRGARVPGRKKDLSCRELRQLACPSLAFPSKRAWIRYERGQRMFCRRRWCSCSSGKRAEWRPWPNELAASVSG